MSRQNADYGYDIQHLYLELMLSDAETFVRCQSIFDYSLFDERLQNTARFISDYMTEYKSMPSYDIVNASTNSKLRQVDEPQAQHYDWLLIDFETFIKHKGLERAIIQSADLLENGEYGPVEDLIKSAVQIGLTKDLGTDYFLDPRTRLMKIKDSNGQMSSGWPTLDKILFGGFNKGELILFAGASGAGKSLFLANLGVNYALSGCNVLYLTLELSEELVAMRIDSMVTGIPSRNIFKYLDDVELKVRTIGKKSGAMQIKYLPSGKNVNDIRTYVKELEIKTSRKIDVLLVDYLDLLMPISKKISSDNLNLKDKYVSEELRNLSMEKQTITISASQLNRGAVEETDYDHSHIAGGISKIQTADNVFGIFTSRAMRENGKYQLQLMKTRNSSGVGQKIELDFNVDTLRITDSGEEPMSIAANAAKTVNTMMNNLQRTSTVGGASNPNEGVTVKSPAAELGSSKLRSLLNNIGNSY